MTRNVKKNYPRRCAMFWKPMKKYIFFVFVLYLPFSDWLGTGKFRLVPDHSGNGKCSQISISLGIRNWSLNGKFRSLDGSDISESGGYGRVSVLQYLFRLPFFVTWTSRKDYQLLYFFFFNGLSTKTWLMFTRRYFFNVV